MLRALALSACLCTPAAACETALLLAIDVSGSIDRGEYALQVQGLADALQDPEIAEVLLRDQVALSLDGFQQRVASLPRAFTGSDTAVGEALSFAIGQFEAVGDCRRKVIDVSGDGPENAGFTVGQARSQAQRQGIEINAIAIEDMGVSAPISSFYRNWVITKDGFVMTARGLGDYPRAIRAKLLRELIKPVG
jgi:Ca-activated chloride channel family protein